MIYWLNNKQQTGKWLYFRAALVCLCKRSFTNALLSVSWMSDAGQLNLHVYLKSSYNSQVATLIHRPEVAVDKSEMTCVNIILRFWNEKLRKLKSASTKPNHQGVKSSYHNPIPFYIFPQGYQKTRYIHGLFPPYQESTAATSHFQ